MTKYHAAIDHVTQKIPGMVWNQSIAFIILYKIWKKILDYPTITDAYLHLWSNFLLIDETVRHQGNT